MRKKRIFHIVIGIVILILLALFCIGFYYVSVMKKTLKEISTGEDSKIFLSVYVLSEDKAHTLKDTVDYSYGINNSSYAPENIEDVLLQIQNALEKQPNVTKYENVFTLIDALKAEEIRAVILDDAYRDSIADAKGYEWVEEGIRKIESFEFEQKNEEKEETVPEEIPESFIVYISGIDTYGDISARSRSDVNILAIVNKKSQKLLMLATPRDYYVDFEVTGGEKDKLTHAGIYGIDQSMDALERLYGIEIDYYLRMNFSGFVNVIDALGGIEVYSDYDFSVQNIKDYHKGYNSVNGLEALAFARERYSFPTGDYQRAKNQIEVIKAVIKKCASPAILTNYGSVMEALAGSFETNMPENQIFSLMKIQIFDRASWEISSYTVDGTSSYKPTFSMPGQNLYVILPDESSVSHAKDLIKAIQE